MYSESTLDNLCKQYLHCVVAENVHTPPSPFEGHWKCQKGGQGVQRWKFQRGAEFKYNKPCFDT